METGMSLTTKRIHIVYFDAGSGHRSSARALASVLTALRPHWQINVVDILDVFAPNNRFQRIVRTGIDHFNKQLIHERLFDLRGLINLSLLCHDLVTQEGIDRIARYWRECPPDAVVSVTPMYNPVLYRSVRAANPTTLCITIPVDFEEVRSRYWFTPKIEQHYLLATDRLAQQAKEADIPDEFLHQMPGMIIDPRFYGDPPLYIPHEIERLGLDHALPTGLVTFGGQGSMVIPKIAAQIAESNLNVNMIFLCGRDAKSHEQVRRLSTPYRKLVLTYTDEPPHYYHHIVDFVIGKPGSMTLTEALITCKPFIFLKSSGMSPVQRGNENWILRHGTGAAANGVKNIALVVKQVLSSRTYQDNAEKHRHDGVFKTAESVCDLVEDRI
jgi:processive 1,2-diacylglycerol beta-glucosyltransferase